MRWQDYLLLLVFGGAALFYYRQRGLSRNKRSFSQKRSGRLTRNEEAAWNKMQTLGYRLEEIHPAIPVTLTVENKSRRFTHSGGFTVAKGGKIYLVKVKRGEGTPLSTSGLRRELMLDFLLFQPAGLFLYDSERGRLQELSLSFSGGTGKAVNNYILQFSLVLLIAAGTVFLYRLFF